MAEVQNGPPVGEVQGVVVVNEVVQVMTWIGFAGAQAERVAAQIGGKLHDFAEFTHSDVKMLTESLVAYQQIFASMST
jgi:hypothetical protein